MKNVNKLLACLAVTVACFAGISPAAYASVAGHVQFVNGDVQLTTAAGQIHKILKGDAVNEGDTLTSAPAASAQIKMQDGGFVAMRPDTKLKFDQFVFAGKQDGSEKSFFSLFKGGFRAVTGLIGQVNKQNYKITTPAATIGIRGTDHETMLITPGSPMALVAPTGVYSKVNVGETTLTTDKGTINVMPNQMGFAGGIDQAPKLQPLNTNIFTVAAAPTAAAAKVEKKEEKAEAKQEQKSAKSEEKKEGGEKSKQESAATESKPAGTKQAASTSTEKTPVVAAAQQEPVAPIRSTAVVDAVAPSAGLIPGAVSLIAPTPAVVAPVIAPPPAPTTIINTAPVTGGTTANLTTGTATTSTGQVIPVTQSMAATQAQAAADAAQAAYNAANSAATAAVLANTQLAALTTVTTTPATNAIGTANSTITTASPLVTSVTALTPANATAAASNAASAQIAATTSASQASAAHAAFIANGVFADSTAVTADSLINTPTMGANALVQSANTSVQTAAGTVTAQNTALTAAQMAASTALAGASTNLTAANNSLNTANSSNTAITTAQGAVAGLVAQAQTAVSAAQADAAAAQTAATQAASFQAAGDFTNAAAQLVIAQQKLTAAQQQQAIAQTASTTLASQLAIATTAQTNAGNAVSAAVNSANSAAANAGTGATGAQTYASAAQTAAANAGSALAQTVVATTGTPANTVQTQAAIVATNKPIAAYNNPAVSGNFIGVAMFPVATVGGFNEAFAPTNPLQLNTMYVLNGSGNLVEARNMPFQVQANQNGTVLTPVITGTTGADITWSGGTAADTFKLADNSIYAGRWMGATVTVKDNALPANVYTYTPAASLWAVLLPPPTGYVQSLVGTTTYTKAGNTTPVDASGNLGVLNSATLAADFTSQLVNAAVNLTMGTGPMAGTFNVSGTALTIDALGSFGVANAAALATNCTLGTCAAGPTGYSADLGGSFAGTGAASAGMSYNIWPTVAATLPASNSVQGLVAFTTATPPTGPVYPAAGNYNVGFIVPVAITGGGYTTGRQIHTPPVANTTIQLDASGNLVKLLGTSYQEPNGATPLVSIASANITWSGGTAADYFQSADGNITFGRYQGGNVKVTDLAVTAPVPSVPVAPFTLSLAQTGAMVGPTSSVWAYGVAAPNNYAQSLVSTTSYIKTGNTTPFDSVGGMGVLNSASLTANFANQMVNAALNLTMNTGVYASDIFNVNAVMPVNALLATDQNGFKTVNPGGSAAVTCSAGSCAGGAFSADVRGTFSGATANDAVLGYGIYATPTINPPAAIISGLVGFNTAVAPTVLAGGPFSAYVTKGVAVAMSTPVSGGFMDSFIVSSADIAGMPTSFINRWGCPGCGESGTTNVLGATTPVTGLATSNAITGIQFGRWTTSTAVENTYVAPLGLLRGPPDSWMYGPQGYLDAAYTGVNGVPVSVMAATFNYALDGANAPSDQATGLKGTLTSASITANFTAMTVSAALGLSMPGETWAASATSVPFMGNQFWANASPGGVGNNMAVTRNALTCPTCGGSLAGGFTGQNYAGAMLSYQLYDNAGSGKIGGNAALTRSGVAGNPAVTNGAPVVPASWLVADYGGSLNLVNAITATGNLLTAYSWGSPTLPANGYGSTTVTCTTCTTTAAGTAVTGATGIYYGTWQAGSWTNTWGNGISPGQFHWAQGPEAGPVYLPEVLTGTVTYALDGGTAPTNKAGVLGTLNSATLTANFTKQVVGISLNATVAGNTWNASTSPGNEMPLHYSSALSKTQFSAWSGGSGPGTLTVSVSNANGTLAANGWVGGNLSGTGLTGAVLSYNLNGDVPVVALATPVIDYINGAAAFVAPASNIAIPYRMVGMSMTDPKAAVPMPFTAGLYNAANGVAGLPGTGVVSDLAGNLTQFDFSPMGGGNASLSAAKNTSTPANFGSDPLTNISWGRWQGGVVNVTDRATGVVTPITLPGSAHWIAGPAMTGPVSLPVSGIYTYTLAGGTLPTNNLGTIGTLNALGTSLVANFNTQTVDVGVNATVGTTTLGALATNLPILQGAAFGAGANMGNTVTVTCSGTCGAAGTHGGAINGGFTGAGATGAGMIYSLGTGLGGAGATVISGVAAFHR